ncbi:HAD family phosphatase [Vibrio sp. SCSIO 43136]|uniref:HAD family hydrolase n=1 Tax=Vibrio sp. SCSIO 43136 TaxID=2819101 RepID=UPI0020757C50|nr:HAD family phosphatase [Vibrio sp. SCSIO 43136]USD67218.1 HAD family phosphatase [Vibrio sp. SCSIO 43136]
MYKNVVFDVGNVLVRWSPSEIIRLTFGDTERTEALTESIFHSEIWRDLNKGLFSEQQAKERYQASLGLTAQECDALFYYVKQTQILIYQTTDLLRRLKAADYATYALTDNVHEIVAHLKQRYDFWPLFDGAIVSAELGLLKPQAEIYRALLEQYQLDPAQTIFLDDMPYNVEGAKACGIAAIQFASAAQAEAELKALGLSF